MTSRERTGNERVTLVVSDHHGGGIAMGPKVKVNVLALKIPSEIKLSRIQGLVWKVKVSLRDDSIAIRERFAEAIRRNLKVDRSIVEAADQPDKSLNGTEAIDFWLAQDQESDGVLIGIEWFLAAALVTRIRGHVVAMPKSEDKEGQKTSWSCGADTQYHKSCGEGCRAP